MHERTIMVHRYMQLAESKTLERKATEVNKQRTPLYGSTLAARNGYFLSDGTLSKHILNPSHFSFFCVVSNGQLSNKFSLQIADTLASPLCALRELAVAENLLSDLFTEAVDERMQARTSPSPLRSLDVSGNKISDRYGGGKQIRSAQSKHTNACCSPLHAPSCKVFLDHRRTNPQSAQPGPVSKNYEGEHTNHALPCEKPCCAQRPFCWVGDLTLA